MTATDKPQQEQASPHGRLAQARAWWEQHPLLVVAVGAGLVAVGHLVWIWTHRVRGAYDPDEAGYVAASLRMARYLAAGDLKGFVIAVGGTGNGIVVPLLSVPLALVDRDPRLVMSVQPVLLVVAAVATAGITRRLSGPRAATAAGLLVAALPMMSTAALSYWYGLGAAAFLTLAVWSLLASDRCAGRTVWWFGVALGCMLLTRTMTLGFVPGLVLAGIVLAWGDGRRLLRLAGATGLGLALAAPWYVVNAESTFGYLFSYGYGPRAARFGSGGVPERAGFRFDRLGEAFGSPVWPLLLVSAAGVGLLVAPRVLRQRPASARAAAAVAVCLLSGLAALVSTSNNGVWFELPMVLLVAALLVAAVSAGPVWYSTLLAAVVTVVSTVSLLSAWWVLPYDEARLPSHYEFGFAEYDRRFHPTRRGEHDAAAAEWSATSQEVLEAVRSTRPGPDALVTLSGNMEMFNANTLRLAGELDGWSPVVVVPDTAAGRDELATFLTPTVDQDGEQVNRVLVLALHDKILFTPDAEVRKFERLARAAGWQTERTVDLPTGGTVEVLRRADPRP